VNCAGDEVFGSKIVEIFSVLQTQLCGFALMGVEPNPDILSFANKFKSMVNAYLSSRDKVSRRFLCACVENSDAIRLGNGEVISQLLSV
jgi:hypothetical protein